MGVIVLNEVGGLGQQKKSLSSENGNDLVECRRFELLTY